MEDDFSFAGGGQGLTNISDNSMDMAFDFGFQSVHKNDKLYDPVESSFERKAKMLHHSPEADDPAFDLVDEETSFAHDFGFDGLEQKKRDSKPFMEKRYLIPNSKNHEARDIDEAGEQSRVNEEESIDENSSAQQGASLPQGWYQHFDEDGTPYYYTVSAETGKMETQWEPPQGSSQDIVDEGALETNSIEDTGKDGNSEDTLKENDSAEVDMSDNRVIQEASDADGSDYDPLPEGWYQHEDENGVPYFYNEAGETSWDRPTSASKYEADISKVDDLDDDEWGNDFGFTDIKDDEANETVREEEESKESKSDEEPGEEDDVPFEHKQDAEMQELLADILSDSGDESDENTLKPLREGWFEADDGKGNIYYYNEAQETTWERPV